MTMVSKPEGTRKSGWIPWVFVGCMLVVVVVNAVMVTMAVRSWSGLVVTKPYERGVQYNKVLDAQQRQDALGWTFVSAYEVTGEGYDGRVLVRAVGADGRPLDGLDIQGKLVRPIERMDPVELSFEAVGDGRYVARTSVPKPGQWELRARIEQGGDAYVLAERLMVK